MTPFWFLPALIAALSFTYIFGNYRKYGSKMDLFRLVVMSFIVVMSLVMSLVMAISGEESPF